MKKFVTRDKQQIAYQTSGEGEAVILIHGLDGNMAALYPTQKLLEPYFHVVIYDLRGHGKSSKPHEYNIATLVEDLKELMQYLKIERAHLIGHDMGGRIVRAFARRYPELIHTMTCIAANEVDIANGLSRLLLEHKEEVAGFTKTEAMWLLFPYMYTQFAVARVWYEQQRLYSIQTPDENAVAMRALLDDLQKGSASHVKDIPALMIKGANDPLVQVENSDDDIMTRPKMEYLVFLNVGHAPHIENERYFKHVYINFLQKNGFTQMKAGL